MKAVGVFAVNDTRARLGSPALLTKLRSSSLVLQVACCCFLAGGFLSARARGFCVLVGGLCLFFFWKGNYLSDRWNWLYLKSRDHLGSAL